VLRRITRGLAPLGLALAITTVVAACDSTTGVDASYSVYSRDSATVYAINGSPDNAPNALSLFGGVVGSSLVPASGSFNFDLAFDVDDQGRPVLLPARTVASNFASPHSVGLQVVSQSYDELTRAPDKGYRMDSTLVVSIGQVIAIQSFYGTACTSFYQTPVIYGKLVVTDVDPSARTLTLKYTADPNCGYRSLTSGVPKD